MLIDKDIMEEYTTPMLVPHKYSKVYIRNTQEMFIIPSDNRKIRESEINYYLKFKEYGEDDWWMEMEFLLKHFTDMLLNNDNYLIVIDDVNNVNFLFLGEIEKLTGLKNVHELIEKLDWEVARKTKLTVDGRTEETCSFLWVDEDHLKVKLNPLIETYKTEITDFWLENNPSYVKEDIKEGFYKRPGVIYEVMDDAVDCTIGWFNLFTVDLSYYTKKKKRKTEEVQENTLVNLWFDLFGANSIGQTKNWSCEEITFESSFDYNFELNVENMKNLKKIKFEQG